MQKLINSLLTIKIFTNMKKITRLLLLLAVMIAWGNVAMATNTECAGTSTDSSPAQGTFTLGYNYTFTTSGTDVTVTFELLDTQAGLVAYAWTYNPGFAEASMTQGTGQVFSKTFSGQTVGSTFSVACKFAFAGGMAVTKTFAYTVGNTCSGVVDTTPPTGFTATLGAVTATTAELLLNGTDDSGSVNYGITYGTTTLSTSSSSGVQKSYIVTGLTPSTAYSFSVTAKDAAGNAAANNPIVVAATTTAVAGPTTSAPTPPAYSAPKVISIFSDAFTNVSGTNYNPGWGQSTAVSTIQIGTDNVLKYSTLNFQGTQFGSDVNASTMKFLHIDVWTANETSLQIYPIMKGDKLEKFYQLTPLNLNQWNSYDIPLTEFTSQGLDLSDLIQFKIVGAGGNTVYLDNIYFYDPSATVDTTPPTGFTATAGTITSDGVELLLNATDDSGAITYTITYGTTPTVLTVPGISGVQKSYTVNGLSGSTAYSFSVEAKDVTGNAAANSPIIVPVSTLASIPAAPVPTMDASKVISAFSDTYTNIGSNGWEDWYGNAFSTVMLNGNTTLKDVASCCFGSSFTTPIDITAMTKLHVDVYPLTTTKMDYGFVTAPANPAQTLTLTTGQWNSIDLNLADLKTLFPAADFTKVKQIGFWNVSGTFYVDNIYFYDDAFTGLSDVAIANGINCYPNPIVNTLHVSAKSEISQVIVRNLLGQSVSSVMINGLSKTIDLSAVASGNYFVTVKLANGQLSTQKIVKL